MRHKILIISAVALFTLSSCGEDFLYKAPQGSIDQEALTNAEGVELLVVNAYAGLTRPTGYDNMFNWVFGGVYGGDANKGSESNDQSVLNSVETYAVTATNDYLQNKWKDAYYGAQRCNLALNVMKEAADMDETTKAYRTAELKFLRALFMFEGVKIFGPTGMPYIDETIAAEENDPKVHNGTDIYPNILADVEAAIEGLPEKQTEVARPTKTAAKALKAKILMQQGDMTAAKPILADIIANGLSPKGERLALQDDLDANFNATTENGKESIFEVQFSVGANNNGNYGFLLNYPHNTGPGGCCGFYQPSYELVNSFQVDENGLPYLDGEYRNKKSVTERVTDYDYITTDMLKYSEVVNIQAVGYDKYNATQWAIDSTEKGLPLEEYAQTLANFNKPTREMERLILSGKAIIDNNEINRYCFRNVTLKSDHNGNIKPNKQVDKKKIDGTISMIQALGMYLQVPHYTNQIFTF